MAGGGELMGRAQGTVSAVLAAPGRRGASVSATRGAGEHLEVLARHRHAANNAVPASLLSRDEAIAAARADREARREELARVRATRREADDFLASLADPILRARVAERLQELGDDDEPKDWREYMTRAEGAVRAQELSDERREARAARVQKMMALAVAAARDNGAQKGKTASGAAQSVVGPRSTAAKPSPAWLREAGGRARALAASTGGAIAAGVHAPLLPSASAGASGLGEADGLVDVASLAAVGSVFAELFSTTWDALFGTLQEAAHESADSAG
jgi:hypothetical protein